MLPPGCSTAARNGGGRGCKAEVLAFMLLYGTVLSCFYTLLFTPYYVNLELRIEPTLGYGVSAEERQGTFPLGIAAPGRQANRQALSLWVWGLGHATPCASEWKVESGAPRELFGVPRELFGSSWERFRSSRGRF